MTSALGSLLERNLLEVFGQRDSASRAVVIAEIYTADCTFYEAEERIVGRDPLNAKIDSILQGAPGFVFGADGPAQVNHDLGRLRRHKFVLNGADERLGFVQAQADVARL